MTVVLTQPEAHVTDEPPVLLERSGPVLVLTLNRPRALNAVNRALSDAVGAALQELHDDPSLRVGVITGAGRAFCAGADLKAITAGEDISHPDWGFAGLVRHRIDKPLIAAVNGFALGGGTEIVLACDLAVLEPGASLGLPEVTRGLFAAAGGVLRLQRHLPPKLAAELALTGQPMSAEAALTWGLVNRVSEQGRSLDDALELAGVIAANAPLAVQASKRLLRDTAVMPDWDDDVWHRNASEMSRVFGSEDAQEGPAAFAQKRPPVWCGR